MLKLNKNPKLELGDLSSKEKNRYWEIKIGKQRLIYSYLLNRVKIMEPLLKLAKGAIGLIVFSILLLPLFIIAVFILLPLKRKYSISQQDDGVSYAITAYKKFMDIYPARVYSPLIKSLELGLFKTLDLKHPSLEIGIGDGYFSSLLFNGNKEKLTIGSDLIYETILSAKKYAHFEKLAVLDVEQVPLPDNCLETVIMNNLMHHLPSREKVFNEVQRILRPGGTFVFTDNLYGWIKHTFDSRLLRFFRLNWAAKSLEKFKLHLFAQKLLLSEDYWNLCVKDSEMEVVVNREFLSKKATTISSIFEYLNFLQGQPTRKSMRLLLRLLPFAKRYINNVFEGIIKYLIIADKSLTKEGEGAYLFVVLRKRQDRNKQRLVNDAKYVCPNCKSEVENRDDEFFCHRCQQSYMVRKGIPMFLSYQKDLKGFKNYLELSDKKKVSEYIT